MDSGFRRAAAFSANYDLSRRSHNSTGEVAHSAWMLKKMSRKTRHISVTMRLLLIDDEEELLVAMSDFFHGRGHQVGCASESEEAIAMVRHHRFDVAIIDLELNSIEGLDGFRVLKALRESCPETRIIVYSGHSSQTIVDSALHNGGAKFIKKPASLPQLLASVEELFRLPC
jgi:DNA-binding NtrC family response regulator